MSDNGRPKIDIDMQQLSGLMRMKPTAEDCAAFFKCSVDTIERRIKEHTVSDEFPEGMTFAEFRDQNMVHTRFQLIRTAIKKSEHSDTMHIFCLKNLCNWGDKRPGEDDKVVTLQGEIKVAKVDLIDRVKQLKGEVE